MRIGLAADGKYNIIDGNDILCRCKTLTEAGAVLHYLNMKPITMLERGIARVCINNWDNEVKARQELKEAKKARQKAIRKAKKQQTPSPDTGSPEQAKETDQSESVTEGAEVNDDHREEGVRTEADSGEES